ncbi:LLM class flavin-dependent oxidoreductase [Cellvibrio japonicus]|uniref:Luciferase-like monooxygenase n=1 Tax=Cellvibrio japonicus (strain Ueda107) TaxID=498211 RepID=B3PE53_CELJU|nr:LLM class flavin-dependent oxidoreductase [Cellvibrio japonicus]ACE84089.1 Luciferase-like monooxygenase [Cellvibrio japonicus Ueda107]
MRSEIPLSLLELASVREGESIHSTLNHSRHYAQAADQLGFTRFWLAEHHNMEGIASSATSVLIGYIAANTERLRVGSGGIMLPNHPPLVIAEQFGTLASLYPDRIDLGLGRAPGTDIVTARALRRDLNAADDFASEVRILEQLLAPDTPMQRLKAIPGSGTQVPIWMLGSSLYSAHLAAAKGLPYAFAGHFAPKHMREAAQIYRNNFTPSPCLDKPYFMLGMPVIVADTKATADKLATTVYQRILALFRGEPMYLKPPVDSMEGLWSAQEEFGVKEFLALASIGTPSQVETTLNYLAAEIGIDEFMFTIDIFDTHLRIGILEMLAGLNIKRF